MVFTAFPLENLRACCWSTVSLPRAHVATIEREAMAHHASSALVVSCQRLESYTTANCGCPAPERMQGFDALLHLAEVAAGLHSVVLGEAQVLGQVRSALAAAPDDVRPFGDVAVASARELRQETRFESHSGHLLDRALRLARVPASGRALVLGSGQMGRLVAARAVALGFDEVIVAGRTEPAKLPAGVRFVPLSAIASLGRADVTVGCLGSGAPEMDVRELPAVRGLLLDLGTPRNFGGIPEVPSLMIADLLGEEMSERPHATRRRTELRLRLRGMVERRLEAPGDSAREAVRELRASVEQVRQREASRIRRLHPEIAPEVVDAITRSLVNQVFHAPTERLRALGDGELAERVAELFGDE